MSNYPKKTICFFNSNRAWGGGEKWHFTTCKEFQRRGYKTFLVTNMRSELAKRAIQERLENYNFYVNNLSFINPLKIFTLAALFRSQKVDAIVLNLPSDLKLAGLAAKLAGVKRIIYRRGMPHPLRNTWLNRFLFQKVLTHVVVNSQEIGKSLKAGNESWFPVEKMVLVYNGVDPRKALTQDKTYPKSGNEIIIGNAGRLTEQKGQKHLIEMAQILKSKGLNFKLLIAGEGELKEKLMKLIEENHLQSEVKLLGHVSDMTGFFNSLDVFVFTSYYEGSANTLIETLQHRIPTIAFDVSSNPEIIENAVNGYLTRPYEAKDLAEKVLAIVQDEGLRRSLIEQGERTVLAKFDSSANLNILEGIL